MTGALSSHSGQRGIAVVLCTGSVLVSLALAPRAISASSPDATTPLKPTVSATLEQCVTSSEQAERSATFSGEMSTLPGAVKMQMRIDVLERTPHEDVYHEVLAPGLGVWRTAAPGVKTFKYLKQVTNLGAPAAYRAAVRFRWINAKGRLIKSLEMTTPKCAQPLTPPASVKPPAEEPAVATG